MAIRVGVSFLACIGRITDWDYSSSYSWRSDRLSQLSQLGIKIGISDSAREVSFHHSTNRVVDGGAPLAAAVWANPS